MHESLLDAWKAWKKSERGNFLSEEGAERKAKCYVELEAKPVDVSQGDFYSGLPFSITPVSPVAR